jgi:hypothetical protein
VSLTRAVLQSARRKLFDLAGSVGMSGTLLRLLERRDRGDRMLVYVGMAVVSAVLLAAWWFLAR